jgi:hypothetical protein
MPSRFKKDDADTAAEDKELDDYWASIRNEDTSGVSLIPAVSITGSLVSPPPLGSKVTSVPRALVDSGSGIEVQPGDLRKLAGDDFEQREVRVLDVSPREDGGILVQENYYIDPGQMGTHMRDQRVIVELSAEAARDFLAGRKTGGEIEDVVTQLQEAVKDE